MNEWQVASVILMGIVLLQGYCHRRERKELIDRLMVDKGHTEYLSDEVVDKKNMPKGSMIKLDYMKKSGGDGDEHTD